MKPDILEGSVVISQKGRDKGRAFVVLYQVDADFVMLCDGDTRKLDRLKRKRRKHLKALPAQLTEIVEACRAGNCKDAEIRKALEPWRTGKQPGTETVGREKPCVEG